MEKELKYKIELTAKQLDYLRLQLEKVYPRLAGEALTINEDARYTQEYKDLIMENADILFDVIEQLETESDILLDIENIEVGKDDCRYQI